MPRPNVRLRSHRERFPLTHAELAERVGVAEITVRRWEAGLRPQPAHVRRLCSVLDASPTELGYGLEDDPAPAEPAPDPFPEERPDLLIVGLRTLLEDLLAGGVQERSAPEVATMASAGWCGWVWYQVWFSITRAEGRPGLQPRGPECGNMGTTWSPQRTTQASGRKPPVL